jgi:hypothetical protein
MREHYEPRPAWTRPTMQFADSPCISTRSTPIGTSVVPIEVAAFDNEAEAMRCFGETHLSVLSRRAGGDADPRDHVTMVVKEPGVDARNHQRRIRERLMRSRHASRQIGIVSRAR